MIGPGEAARKTTLLRLPARSLTRGRKGRSALQKIKSEKLITLTIGKRNLEMFLYCDASLNPFGYLSVREGCEGTRVAGEEMETLNTASGKTIS